jgi:DNA integrity scanning protein DisA with diadenylate cyclase activity
MTQNQKIVSPSELTETRLLVRYGFDLARKLNIKKVMVMAELLSDRKLVGKHRDDESIIWVMSDPEAGGESIAKRDSCVEIPYGQVGRMDLVSLAVILSVLKGFTSEDESIVCLVGALGSKRIDNLLIVNPKRDFDWFKNQKGTATDGLPVSQEFIRLIDIALRFSREGREGKNIGTVFLLGNAAELNTIGQPLILNPLKGHPKKSRSIHDNEFVETMREFAALDGAFTIDQNGVVVGAAVYLDAPVTKKVKVPKGLGSRHLAAAAATARTTSIAIVISESSGSVTVFSKGAQILSLGNSSSRNR